MFFSITTRPQNNFSVTYQLGSFCINTDAGWHNKSVEVDGNSYTVIYKGYAEGNLLDNILNTIIVQDEPTILGNFCAIIYDPLADQIAIRTDRYRSFPLYVGNNTVTNLEKQHKTIWSDNYINISNRFNIVEHNFDLVGTIDLTPIGLDDAVSQIDYIISTRTENFLNHNHLPIMVHLSGGVDSLLVYSYLQKYTQDFAKVSGQHFEYDHFWLENSGTIADSHWAYRQIHHWTDDCVLLSGAPGDEFMLRNPATADLLMKFNGVDIKKLLVGNDSYYHYEYFMLPKNYKIFTEQQVDTSWTRKKLVQELCNNVVNDWQHWHIGKTLTWTPLRDLELFKIFLRLDTDSALSQILNSSISKRLIENNKAGLSKYLGDQKNSGNILKNLSEFYNIN